MIYGYIRVSTDMQTTENQRFEIGNFIKKQGFVIDKWFEETISGTKDIKERQLGKVLKNVEIWGYSYCNRIITLREKFITNYEYFT